MATKYEIKKYLERKRDVALNSLQDDFQDAEKTAEENFLYRCRNEISAVKKSLSAADDLMDVFITKAKDCGAEFENSYYNTPKHRINSTFNELSDSNLLRYLKLEEIERLRIKHDKAKEDTKEEYQKLIATTQAMNAKNGIELLNSLGFNTSELFTEKEVTAITTVFDTRKLLITSQEVK